MNEELRAAIRVFSDATLAEDIPGAEAALLECQRIAQGLPNPLELDVVTMLEFVQAVTALDWLKAGKPSIQDVDAHLDSLKAALDRGDAPVARQLSRAIQLSRGAKVSQEQHLRFVGMLKHPTWEL